MRTRKKGHREVSQDGVIIPITKDLSIIFVFKFELLLALCFFLYYAI